MSIPDLPRPQGGLGGFPHFPQLFGHHSALWKQLMHVVKL